MRNKNIKSKYSGFTIIELLVVIAVVGILASITVIGYSNWRASSILTQIKSDLNGVKTAMEDARNFGNSYPLTIPTSFTPSEGITLTGGGAVDGKSFCITAANGSVVYHITDVSADVILGSC